MRQHVCKEKEENKSKRRHDLRRKSSLKKFSYKRHHENSGKSPRNHQLTGLLSGKAQEVLAKYREDKHRCEQSESKYIGCEHTDGQFSVFQNPQIDDRMF